MPRRIPVSILSLTVLLLGSFCLQYGRYAGQRAEIAAHIERGRAARYAAGFSAEGEAVASHPAMVLHRKLGRLEEKLRLTQGFDQATLLQLHGFSDAAQWARLEPACEEVRRMVTHCPAPEDLNAARPEPMRNLPWFVARSLLLESADRALRRGDLLAAAEDWGAVIDLGRAQWAHSPLPLTLATVTDQEVQVLRKVQGQLPSCEDAEVICRVLQPRLSSSPWDRDDVLRAVRGEGVALCELLESRSVVDGLAFHIQDFGFGALKATHELMPYAANFCGLGIADPEALLALGESRVGSTASLAGAIDRANRERDLARAALFAHAEHGRTGKWPGSLEEMSDLDPETASRLTVEKNQFGRYIAVRGEAELVARKNATEYWMLAKLKPQAAERSSH